MTVSRLSCDTSEELYKLQDFLSERTWFTYGELLPSEDFMVDPYPKGLAYGHRIPSDPLESDKVTSVIAYRRNERTGGDL